MTATTLQHNPVIDPVLENLSNTIIQTVSSELSTPLNVMMGYASLLNEGALGDLTPEQQSAMASIMTRADDMRSLVTRLSTLMEAEAGIGQRQYLDFWKLVQQVLSSKTQRILDAGLSIHLPERLSSYRVIGNQMQLFEMVASLIDNAIKFTPRNGSIRVDLSSDKEFIYLKIEDTGIGIAENSLEDIFTSFRKANKKDAHGLGLGLSIVRAVATKHGGDAYVKSNLGTGSRFIVKLPLASTAQASATAIIVPLNRILIVDDDDGVAFTLQHALERLPNCEITVADSGEAALHLFAEESFDLVFTDYQMPQMNGVELAKALRTINASVSIILITAYNNQAVQENAAELGVHRYLDKPLDIKEIRQTVLEALKKEERINYDI